MTHKLFDAWTTRHRRRQASRGPHPTLWVVLAVVSALLGAGTSAWRNADTELALGFAASVRGFVGALLDEAAHAGGGTSSYRHH